MMSSVMSNFDPNDRKPDLRKTAPHRAVSKRITGINPTTGELSVEGGSDVPLYLYTGGQGGNVVIAPMRDDGIDQDPVAHAARRPRSMAEARGIDQLG